MGKLIRVFVNGQEQRYNKSPCLAEVIQGLSLLGKRIAVECNGCVVARADHAGVLLHDGDRVEIVEAIGGG